jgi:hypothetical protein
MDEIKFDKRNYRLHNDENKRVIKKSLKELGAGRSIVIDNDGEIIAGNGVYEQAKKLGIKTKIVETDGSELVVVKRTDLATGDDKRKKLALADNAASDTSEWANDLLREDWTPEVLADFGVKIKIRQLDENGEYEDTGSDDAVTEYEKAQILSVDEEYIIITCTADEFDEVRKHFGLGFIRPLESGVKYQDKREKARVIKWSDYVNSNTK